MKASETKTASQSRQHDQQQGHQPFFQKEGEGRGVSEAQVEVQAFFLPASSQEGNPFFTPTANEAPASHPQPKTENPLPSPIQPKLKIGQPNDKYEREADTTADQVMKHLSSPTSPDGSKGQPSTLNAQPSTLQRQEAPEAPEEHMEKADEGVQMKPIFESAGDPGEEGGIQRKAMNGAPPIQRQEMEEAPEEMVEKAEEDVQMKPAFESVAEPPEENVQAQSEDGALQASPNLEGRLNSNRGRGSALPEDTRSNMESAFGADFSGVRVHTDNESAQMNQELGAKAFTHGSDIYFNSGQYDTGSGEGQQLLAHELTHTVQQGASIQKKPAVSSTPAKIQRGVFGDAVEWIKGKIASGLNWAAERLIPGYSLLNVILGKNLITDEPVARSGVNIIRAYMRLIPVIGSVLLSQLEETETLTQAGAWAEEQVAKFGINFDDIAQRLTKMWDEMSVWNSMKTNVAIFQKYIGPVLGKFLAFSSVVQEKCKELRLEGALRLVGAHELLQALKKSPAALKKVIDKPSLILGFFIDALKQGFTNFKNNFGKHFRNALLGWLFGKAAEMGVTMPKKFNIAGLFHLIAQLVGATYSYIRGQVVKRLGPKGEAIVTKIEQTVTFVKDLITKGPIALWEKVKEFLSNLKEMFFSKIKELVITEIVKTAVMKIASMLNPAGAIVQLALTIYKVIKFFIDNWQTIKDIATGVLGAITKVALGSVGGAAAFIEGIFAKGVKLIIGFLARIFGLSGIAKKVKALIKKISDPVKKAIGKVIAWIVDKGKKLWARLTGKGKKGKAPKSGDEADLQNAIYEAKLLFEKPNTTVESVKGEMPQIRSKYKLKTFELVKDAAANTYHLKAHKNPTLEGPPGILFTEAELIELEKVAIDFANQLKADPRKLSLYKSDPKEFIRQSKAGKPGDFVEATAEPVLKELASAANFNIIRGPFIRFVDSAGNFIGGAQAELDFLVVSDSGAHELISAKLPTGKFSLKQDKTNYNHLRNIPLSPPEIVAYAQNNFGRVRKYSDIDHAVVVSSLGEMPLSEFRSKYLTRSIDQITITKLTPGPEKAEGLQLRFTKDQLVDKAIELINKHI